MFKVCILLVHRVKPDTMTLSTDYDDELWRILALVGIFLGTNRFYGRDFFLEDSLELALGYA